MFRELKNQHNILIRELMMRLEAFPSQSGGIVPFFHLPSNNLFSTKGILSRFVPISSFVPRVTVSGRSVLFLRVIHGIPMTVVSSVIPPESVITAFACCTK